MNYYKINFDELIVCAGGIRRLAFSNFFVTPPGCNNYKEFDVSLEAAPMAYLESIKMWNQTNIEVKATKNLVD